MNRLVLLIVLVGLGFVVQAQRCGTPLKGGDQKRLDQAIADLNNQRYERAKGEIYKVLKRNPNCADAIFYAGILAVANNNVAAIRKHFERLELLCADYADARAYLYEGIIHYSDDDFEGAVQLLERFFDTVRAHPSPTYDALYEEASVYLHWSRFLAEAQQNAVPFNPRVLIGASSKRDEYMPYLAPDGQTIYYLRAMPEDDSPTFYARELQHMELRLCASRWKDTSFDAGQPLAEPFNTHESEGGIALTADGKTLFVSAMQRQRGYANYDIYTSCQDGSGFWQPLEPLGNNVNGERTWESQPTVSADGQWLYFASNRAGGQGGTDIWRCHRLPNGDWSRAENLGPSVNTKGNEKCPFLHADGHTLFFASNGWQGFGGYDMYFIDLGDPTTAVPTNLGLPINSEGDEICFGITTQGNEAYYAARPHGMGAGGSDILMFDLYPAARPEAMRLVGGQAVDEQGRGVAARVGVWRATGEADYRTDSLGNFALMLSQQENNVVGVTAEGFVPAVFVGSPRKVEPQLKQVQLHRLKVDARQPLNITAKGGRLGDEEKRLLDVYVDFLLAHPMVNIRLEAPTEAAVQAMRDYMASRKLRTSRIATALGSTAIVVVTQI